MAKIRDVGTVGYYVANLYRDDVALPILRINNEIPEIKSTYNNISEMIQFKVKNTADEKTRDIDVVNQIIDNYTDLKGQDEYSNLFAPIDALATELSNNVQTSFNILRYTIKPMVDDLKKTIESEVEARSQLRTKRDTGVVVAVSGNDSIEVDSSKYHAINWNILNNFPEPQNLAMYLEDVFKIKLKGDYSDFNRMLNSGELQLIDINADPQIREDMESRLLANIDVVDHDKARKFISTLIGSIHDFSDKVLAGTLSSWVNNPNEATTINNCIATLSELIPFIDAFSRTELNCAPLTCSEFKNNLAVASVAMSCIAYVLVCARRKLEGVLVVNDELINSDLLDEMEKQDITTETIAKYVYTKFVMSGRPVPAHIKLSDIASSRDKIESSFAQVLRNRKLILDDIKNTLVKAEGRRILDDFLKNIDSSLIPGNMSREQFYNIKCKEIGPALSRYRSSDDNLSVVLYDFLIRALYDKTIIGTVHKLLGDEVVRRLSVEGSQEMTETDLKTIDVVVATRILCSYLMQNVFIATRSK